MHFLQKKKSRELAIRCVLHASLHEENCFLTLTYDETKPDYENKMYYKHIQDFKKRLRRECDYHYNKKIQIFNVHEYGKNGKKHWHLVIFNHNFSDKKLFTTKNGNTLYVSNTLLRLWPFGHHTIGDVSEASAMYQAQYTQKDIENGNTLNEKKAKSNHSGIGKAYFLLHYRQILSLGYIPFNGTKAPIPRYFYKIAHRHYCHFYDTSAFFDNSFRKKLYSPFNDKKEKPNQDLADHFIKYNDLRKEKIDELIQAWNDELDPLLFSKQKRDFLKSAENYLYDQQNKNKQERF